MNLFLRLLRVILHSFFRPRLGIMDTSVLTFWVLPWDLDINFHLTNSRYLSLMDLGRLDLMLRTGVGKQVREKKWGAVLGSAALRFRKGLNLFQRFELHTNLLYWDSKWLYMEQTFRRKGRILAIAYVKGMFVSAEGGVPLAQVFEILGTVPEVPPPTQTLQLFGDLDAALRKSYQEKEGHHGKTER
jgi:acyl-CoA thioesterase FadM